MSGQETALDVIVRALRVPYTASEATQEVQLARIIESQLKQAGKLIPEACRLIPEARSTESERFEYRLTLNSGTFITTDEEWAHRIARDPKAGVAYRRHGTDDDWEAMP